MGDHIVAILLRCQIIGSGDYFLNDWNFNITPRELLEHTLDHAAASLVLAEQKDLVFYERDNELDLTGR